MPALLTLDFLCAQLEKQALLWHEVTAAKVDIWKMSQVLLFKKLFLFIDCKGNTDYCLFLVYSQ